MEFSEYRPIISGLLGAVVTTWLCAAWAKWLPKGKAGKDANTILLQNRIAVILANASFFTGLGIGIYLYFGAGYASNDWRPIALSTGIAFSAPLLVLPLVAKFRGTPIAEAYVAFALNQKTPMFVLYPILALGVPLLALAVASF